MQACICFCSGGTKEGKKASCSQWELARKGKRKTRQGGKGDTAAATLPSAHPPSFPPYNCYLYWQKRGTDRLPLPSLLPPFLLPFIFPPFPRQESEREHRRKWTGTLRMGWPNPFLGLTHWTKQMHVCKIAWKKERYGDEKKREKRRGEHWPPIMPLVQPSKKETRVFFIRPQLRQRTTMSSFLCPHQPLVLSYFFPLLCLFSFLFSHSLSLLIHFSHSPSRAHCNAHSITQPRPTSSNASTLQHQPTTLNTFIPWPIPL